MFSRKPLWILLIVLLVFPTACTPVATEPAVESTGIPTETPMPKATSTPMQPTMIPETATPERSSDEQEVPSAEQEELYKEWFLSYTSTVLLFETCDLMMGTHASFQQSEIDLVEARAELAAESNTIELVSRQFVNEVPSEATALFLAELDVDLQELIVVWEQMNASDTLGGAALEQELFNACTPFWENITTIAYAAMDAGVSENSLHEMDAQIEDIIDVMRNSVLE